MGLACSAYAREEVGLKPEMERNRIDELLRLLDAEGPVRGLVSRLPSAVYIESLSEDGRVRFVGPQLERILGYAQDEWTDGGNTVEHHIHPEDRDRVIPERRRASEAGEAFEADFRMLAKDGSEVWVHEGSAPIESSELGPGFRQGAIVDITEHKDVQAQLEQTEGQFRALVEHIPAALYIDPPQLAERTSYISPQIETILGVTPERWIAEPALWEEHLHPEDRQRAMAEYSLFLETGEPEVSVYRMLRPDGKVVWINDVSMIVRDANGEPVVVQGAMFDVTAQKEAEQQIAYMAQHDRLTGLPNRPMFEELLDLALARARRSDLSVAVLFLDMDNFKLINDSLGHAAGDEMLRQMAVRLHGATRETDLVARQGGDEFLILLADIEGNENVPGPDMDSALLTAESVVTRVHQALEAPFLLGGTEAYATTSIGISLFPAFAGDARSLLRQADSAMYRSKKMGPGGHVVYSSDATDALNQLSLTTRLRKAVDNRHWVLHYQPLVELSTGRMIGVEALLRWLDPNAGMIPPGEFIPLAEEMGLIEAIGDWVMEELFSQASEWERKGIDLQEISFNLSPRQLWQPDLAAKIFRHLDSNAVDPQKVVIEITESTAMTDPERTQHILWDLHGRGLRLAIDDFGTGYSSLSRLKHMPVSTLKIDRAFVMDVPDDPDAGNMVSAIVGLAHSLGMKSLAEGIETEEQWRFMVERGCEQGQGFYFSRPVPAAEIEALHARGVPLTQGHRGS